MSHAWRLSIIVQALCFVFSLPATAGAVRLGVYDTDDSYIVGLLSLALKEAGSDEAVDVVPHMVPQNRALRDLIDGTAPYNIFYSGYDPTREAELRMIPIPLTRGLLGYRMLAARADTQELFKGIQTFKDLKTHVSFGAGSSWPDRLIMKTAGLRVVTGPDDTLWPMLERGRFLAFPRGVNEIGPEIAHANRDFPDARFRVAPNLMIAYRFDTFFYVAKSDERLAELVERGLMTAYRDGSFMAYFSHHPDIEPMLDDLMTHKREVFWLENPLMSDTVRNIPARFWQAVPGRELTP